MKAEDLPIIAEHLIRYAPCKPKLALDRLLKIEIFRNNFSKSTIFNWHSATRRLLKDGYITKAMPKTLAKEILRQTNKPAQPQHTEPAMDVPQTPYEKYTKLTKDYEQIQNFINEQIEKLEKAKEEYDKSCDDKIQYWNRQIIFLGSEYRKLSEEILKQGTYDLFKFINEQ